MMMRSSAIPIQPRRRGMPRRRSWLSVAQILDQAQLFEDAAAALGLLTRIAGFHGSLGPLDQRQRVEGLGHVLEDALLPPPHLVLLGRAGREQDDGDVSGCVLLL